MGVEYKISDTTFEAEWVKTGWSTSRQCSNCNHTISVPYQTYYAPLGKFCPNCGFRMKNPGSIKLEIDYD